MTVLSDICAFDGCREPVRQAQANGKTRYCSMEHANKARARQKKAWRDRDRSEAPMPQRRHAESKAEAESRQPPPYRTYQLPPPRVVIKDSGVPTQMPERFI